MRTKTFDRDYLTRTLELPYNFKYAISDEIVDNGRWNIEHKLLFTDPADNKVYQTSYSVGATEMQLERPWEYENTVEATEMELTAVIEKKYMPAGERGAWEQNVDAFIDFLRSEGDIFNDLSLYDIKAALQCYASHDNEQTQEAQETIMEPAVTPAAPPVQENDIDHEAFLKFVGKLRKKLDDIFYLDEETTFLQLDAEPSPDDTFAVNCTDGTSLSYCLRDLYTRYMGYKDTGVSHPLKVIVNDIEDAYDLHDSDREVER